VACCPANRICPLMVPTVLRPASTSAPHAACQRQAATHRANTALQRPAALARAAAQATHARAGAAPRPAGPQPRQGRGGKGGCRARAPSSVVLDEPLGPISADRWPGGINPDTSVSSLIFCFLLALFQTV